jgi:hypothetical protein
MKDREGREQKAYLVQDKKTGKTYMTYETYAKKLEKLGTKRIIAQEGTKAFEKGKVTKLDK